MRSKMVAPFLMVLSLFLHLTLVPEAAEEEERTLCANRDLLLAHGVIDADHRRRNLGVRAGEVIMAAAPFVRYVEHAVSHVICAIRLGLQGH